MFNWGFINIIIIVIYIILLLLPTYATLTSTFNADLVKYTHSHDISVGVAEHNKRSCALHLLSNDELGKYV